MAYRDRLTEEQWVRLKAAVQEAGKVGPFDANAVLKHFLDTEHAAGRVKYEVPLINAGDVPLVLRDMVDLGDIRELGGDPPMWELAGE